MKDFFSFIGFVTNLCTIATFVIFIFSLARPETK